MEGLLKCMAPRVARRAQPGVGFFIMNGKPCASSGRDDKSASRIHIILPVIVPTRQSPVPSDRRPTQ